MSNVIKFEDSLNLKNEKEEILKKYKDIISINYNDLYNDDWYSDEYDEHPNKKDIETFKKGFDSAYNLLLKNNVDINQVKSFVKKIETYFKNENNEIEDILNDTLIILYFFNLYNIYQNRFISLSDEDVSYAINIYDKSSCGVDAKYLNHSCDLIINQELFKKVKDTCKNNLTLITTILSINEDLDYYCGVNTKEKYLKNREVLLEKITNSTIDSYVKNKEERNDTFNIGIFEPKSFAKKLRDQAEIYFTFDIEPSGMNKEELKELLDSIENVLYSIDKNVQKECFDKLKSIWMSDQLLLDKLNNIFDTIKYYTNNKRRFK